MLQLGGDRDLAQEALVADGGRQLGAEHLDRDRPLVLHIGREKHDGHAPGADFPFYAVAVSERGVQAFEHVVILRVESGRR